MRVPAYLLIFTIYSLTNLSFATTAQIQSDVDIATAGYFQLTWSNIVNNSEVIVEESKNSGFIHSNRIYQGFDSSTVVSGKSNGDYFYRIKTTESNDWSSPIKVTVQHHSLTKAFLFFLCGLIIFVATTTVIIKNSRQ